MRADTDAEKEFETAAGGPGGEGGEAAAARRSRRWRSCRRSCPSRCCGGRSTSGCGSAPTWWTRSGARRTRSGCERLRTVRRIQGEMLSRGPARGAGRAQRAGRGPGGRGPGAAAPGRAQPAQHLTGPAPPPPPHGSPGSARPPGAPPRPRASHVGGAGFRPGGAGGVRPGSGTGRRGPGLRRPRRRCGSGPPGGRSSGSAAQSRGPGVVRQEALDLAARRAQAGLVHHDPGFAARCPDQGLRQGPDGDLAGPCRG